MTICLTCGKNINTPLARECPFCHAPLSVDNLTHKAAVDKFKHDYDCKDNKLLWISFFVFPYGLYFYSKNKEESPMRSSSALGGALLGIVLWLIVITLLILGSLF